MATISPNFVVPLPRRTGRQGRLPLTLIALFVPACLFVIGLFFIQDEPRYQWLRNLSEYPLEFWIIAGSGLAATGAGVADWIYHRSGGTTIGPKEHFSELLALAAGGVPLFVLMSAASLLERPAILLLPIIVCVLFTAVMICYDEFVFHRKRCGPYETTLHRLLVYGNGTAWLAWMNWCVIKYGLACAAALPWPALAFFTAQPLFVLLCIPAFYAVEAQMVFLFPLVLDGCDHPYHEARRWTCQAGETLTVMGVVLPIAVTMLLGGFVGRGFVRSWSLGCLAVCLWYEDLRRCRGSAATMHAA